jgi:hypothetical protein
MSHSILLWGAENNAGIMDLFDLIAKSLRAIDQTQIPTLEQFLMTTAMMPNPLAVTSVPLFEARNALRPVGSA